MTKFSRVGFLINSLRSGGAETVFLNELTHLGGLGVDAVCITLTGLSNQWLIDHKANICLHPRQLLELDRIKKISLTNVYHCLDSNGEVSLKTAFKLAQYIRSSGITCLYTTLDSSIKIGLLAKLFYGDFRLIVREARIYSQKPIYLKLLDRTLCQLVDQYVAVSYAVSESMPLKIRAGSGRVSVLKNGVRTKMQRSDYGLPVVNLVTVASLREVKRIDLVIKAFGYLSDLYPKLNLLIIGSGELEADLKRLSHVQPGTHRIQFLGLLTGEQIEWVYRRPSVFVLASDSEGCPNALLDAMAHALPCVGSNAPGILEVLGNGVFGAIFQRGSVTSLVSTLCRVLDSSDYRSQIGRNGQRRVQTDYSLQQHFIGLDRILFPEGLPVLENAKCKP